MAKIKAAIYWCSSCGGCDEAIVDMGEKLLVVRELVDFVFWPCAMDPKYSDVEAMADGEIDLCLINGAVRTSEQEHISPVASQVQDRRGSGKLRLHRGHSRPGQPHKPARDLRAFFP